MKVSLEELDTRIENFEVVLDKLKARREGLKIQETKSQNTVTNLDSKITANLDDILKYQKAIEVFKDIADTRNDEAKAKLEETINWALSQIPLEQNYSIVLEESESGKELDIKLRELESGRERSLKDQSGIALCQIVSFLLDIILICISNSTRIMILDEAFSGLEDKEMIQIFGEILVALARTENFQFIMIEHKTNLDSVEGIIPIELKYTNYKRGTVINQPSLNEMEQLANLNMPEVSQQTNSNFETTALDDDLNIDNLLNSDFDFTDDSNIATELIEDDLDIFDF